MKLYADPITVNCRKVVAGLDLIGAEYELVHVDYFTSQQRAPEYIALNPNASLPTLVDGEFVLWESNAMALIALSVDIGYGGASTREIAMDLTAFETWLGEIAALTEPQRRRAWQALALSETAYGGEIETPQLVDRGLGDAGDEPPATSAPPPLAQPSSPIDVVSVAELGHRRVERIGCPHCDNDDVVRWGQASDLPRYRCKACRRTFNALTKTPLANLRMKEKWAAQTAAMIDGVSTAKAAQRCGVHYTTAFRWRHRFLTSLAGDKPKTLTGVVEGDETFILESFKGKRSDMPRKSRKRGGKSAKRGLSAE